MQFLSKILNLNIFMLFENKQIWNFDSRHKKFSKFQNIDSFSSPQPSRSITREFLRQNPDHNLNNSNVGVCGFSQFIKCPPCPGAPRAGKVNPDNTIS
jgi:hypothetical protein